METDEAPFCRVCRGEGTADEPLFHPCRCSGSIRHVHQECLEEWLSHSSKRYCELCGYEYAFSPLYDPNMPESIPKTIIVRQIVSSVVMYILSVVRTLFVAAMWLFVLPYIVYWLMRFYFWGSQSLFASISSKVPPLSQNESTLDTTNVTSSVASTISMRFDGFDSWHEWYTFSLKNETVAPIISFTGILDGASNSVLAVYRMIRVVLMVGAWVLKASLGVQLSKVTLDGAAETMMEFLAKSFEGIMMTLSAVMIFLALFILRDWILTNMPAADNIVDEVDEQIAQIQDGQQQQQQQQQQPPQPPDQQQEQHNDQGQNHVPNRIQVQAQPIVAENPQNRPMFELPEFELPLLDDLPPGERPIHPQRHQQRSPGHTGANTPVSDTSNGSSWTSASSASDSAASSQSSPIRRDISAVEAQDQIEALANEDAGMGTSYGKMSTPSTSNSHNIWTYAEEACGYDTNRNGISSSSNDRPVDNHSYADNAEPSDMSTRFGKEPERIPSSPNVRIGDDEHSPAVDIPGSADSDGASWSFVLGESSQKTDRFSLPTDVSRQGSQSPHVDEDLPPTFTAERSRSIIGHIDNADNADHDAVRSSDDENDDDDDLPLYARRLQALQQAEWERNIGIMQPNQMREPNFEQNFNPEPPNQDNPPAQPLLQAVREDPAPLNAIPNDEEQPINNGNGEIDNADDNFGEFDDADGILEAVGFRGPLLNAVQYFILVLLMVGLVLAFSVWLPFIVAQACVLLNPIRAVLYIIHVLSKVVDTVGELFLDIALVFVLRPLRLPLVIVVNSLGPFIAYGFSLLVPGIKDALSVSNTSLWDKLSSPDVQTLLLKSLRQSWIIQLLFPWIRTAPTKTVAAATVTPEAVIALSSDIAGKAASSGRLVNIYTTVTWPITYVASWIGWLVDGIYDFVFTAAMPTPSAPEISTVLSLYDWERSYWQKLVGWGIPIDRFAARLHHAVTGASLDDRMMMITIGHILGVFSAWAITTFTPKSLRKTTIYVSARMFLLMAKIVLFISIELLLFPIICGYCLELSLAPLISTLSIPPSYLSKFRFLFSLKWTALVTHWMMGMFFMIHFARFVFHLRLVVRPGLLWFIRDPSDPNFHPIRDIIEDKMLPQQYNIARSAIMYCAIILTCVGLSMVCTVYVAPKDMFPMKWNSAMQLGEYPVQVITPLSLLLIIITRGRPNEMLHCIFSWWWRVTAHLVRLSEFIIGQRSIVDEGSWTILSAPWLPDTLIRVFMPSSVVKGVFETFKEHVFDEARVGRIEGALPTTEYRTQLQLEIDLALSATYPNLAFVLNGQNMRAPNTDTIPVVVGRKMVIPVDDHGRPAEDRFDYEAADYPEIRYREENQDRDLPPAAPGSSYRDRRFNPDQHSVIFVPPRLRARVVCFVVLGWVSVAVVSGTTLVLSLMIGRNIYSRLSDFPRHDVFALALGLLVLLTVSIIVYRIAPLISDLYGRRADRVAALQRLKQRAAQAGAAVYNSVVCSVVFCGIVPAAYGLVMEVYFVVLFRDYIRKLGSEDVLTRPLWQAMAHNWIFGILHVWIGSSVLRFFPESYWSRQMDRLFTGPPHTWHLWEGIKVFAVPIVGVSLLGASLPFVLTLAFMFSTGTLNARSAAELLMMKDVSLLAVCSKIVLVSALMFLATWQACFMYKQWTRLARDDAYLVGRQLHNLGEAAAPSNSADQTHVPVAAGGEDPADAAD